MHHLLITLSVLAACVILANADCAPITPYNGTHHFLVKFTYCSKLNTETRKYPENTRVRARCPNKKLSVVGSDRSHCVNNKWEPELGRCPYSCNILEFTEEYGLGYAFTQPRPGYEDPNYYKHGHYWKYNGTEINAFCARGLIAVWSGGHHWRCIDGRWVPADQRYSWCKYW